MTETRRRTLQQILEEAQTLPPAEQLRFIRAACSDDSGEIAAEEAELSRQGWFQSELIDSSDAQDPAGQAIGPYRLVRSLGKGGMGEVFLAERADDQFRQKVAIKLVRRGLLSRHI